MAKEKSQEPKDDLWQRFLASDGASVSEHVLDTWLRPVRYLGRHASRQDQVVLEVRDQFFRDWLKDHYQGFIQEGLRRLSGEPLGILWQISALPLEREKSRRSRAPAPAAGASAKSQERSKSSAEDPRHSQLEMIGLAEEEPKRRSASAGKNKTADKQRVVAVDKKRGKEPRANPTKASSGGVRMGQLNPRYRFDTFVCGPSNQFAHAATKAVSEMPGTSYNPLFIFGGVGLGKTHLLCAIGHQLLERKRGAQIVYASAEQFTNDVVHAVLGSKLDAFRNKYRRDCDAILIDDIQLIAGKERTQHEFFHIFNTLHDQQKQIVVTSDKLPHEIPAIEERLRSRFQWGLIADIQPPEMETRVAILRKKAEVEGLTLPDDVAFFLAKSVRSNVRELEGALVRVMAHASLHHVGISVAHAKEVLEDVLSAGAEQRISVAAVQKSVAVFFNVGIDDLRSRRRLKQFVVPRQIAMYLCRKYTDGSFPEIGEEFHRDHTTVISACAKVENSIKADATLRSQVQELERQLDVRMNPN